MSPTPRHTAMLSQSLAAHRNKAPTRGLSHEQTPPFARLTLDGDATPAITRCPAPRPPPYRCTQSTVPAKQAPPHRPSTLTTLMPPPRLRRAAASKIVTPTHAAGSPPPPLRAGARATGRVCMLRRGQAPCQAMPSEAPVPARRHDPTLSATTLAPWWTGPLHGRPRGRCAALVVGRGRLTHESPPPKGRDK